MKKTTYISTLIWITILSICSLLSCRDDLSMLDSDKIEGVEVDTTGMSTLTAFQFETLSVSPTIKTNLEPSRLAYEWKVSRVPGDIREGYEILGTTPSIAFDVNLLPTKSSIRWDLYDLVLTVTDTRTGLDYITVWPLVVRNSIGEGLVIAETYDGATTDISHIMSPRVTSNYTGESVKYKIFSNINGYTMPGLMTDLKWSSLRTIGNVMLGITDHSIEAIRTSDYVHETSNEDLFFTPPAVLNPQALVTFRGGTTYIAALVNNGQLYTEIIGNTGKFGLPADFPYTVPTHIAVNRRSSPDVYLNFYDEGTGSFIYRRGYASYADRNMYQMDAATTPFNPRNLPGKTVLAADFNEVDDFVHVLKDRNSNQVGIYVNSGNSTPLPKSFYDISNAPEIADAEYFVILADQQVVYYATRTRIYAVMFSASTPAYALRYTVPVGEEITTLQLFQQADYANRSSSEPYISTNNKQLVMSTYNGTEGKVYLLPFQTLGLAIIDEANVVTYGGFGRITAIAAQL